MKTQNARLLATLKAGASVTPLSALQTLGVFRLAARVRDLRDQGEKINSDWCEVRNQWGESCRVKRYWMAKPSA